MTTAPGPDHVCTIEWCGHTCTIEDDGPVRDYHRWQPDAGEVDGEGPCDCEDHEPPEART